MILQRSVDPEGLWAKAELILAGGRAEGSA